MKGRKGKYEELFIKGNEGKYLVERREGITMNLG